jgi:mannose-1-phosphate guanylyltransferase/phosphomannomutase
MLLLYVRLLAQRGVEGKAAFPVTVTSKVEALAGEGLEIIRTPNTLSDLTSAASGEGVVFAGAVGGGYVFPEFLPAYDAVASLAKLLELLAPIGRPFSELVAELPQPTLIHSRIACPWSRKGLVMRVLNERLAGRDVDLTDGIKLLDDRGWSQVLPDPDEPLLHLYAEGETTEVSEELEREVRELVEQILQGESAAPRTSVEASS